MYVRTFTDGVLTRFASCGCRASVARRARDLSMLDVLLLGLRARASASALRRVLTFWCFVLVSVCVWTGGSPAVNLLAPPRRLARLLLYAC